MKNLIFSNTNIKKIGMMTVLCCLFLTCAVAQQVQFFSPINALAVGPNGLATNKLKVQPYCCPSTAIEITAPAGASDNDLQWVLIPLNGIVADNINSITVCYQVVSANKAPSFISQVRLTEMTLPNAANVKVDDPTNLYSTAPTCVTVKAGYKINGTTTLALRIALAVGDKIIVGGIAVNQ